MNNGKICVSVCAETADEVIAQIRRAEDLADVIEIRFDCLNESELEKTDFRLPASDREFLITFRPREQGGKREITLRERLKFWEKIFWQNRGRKFFIDYEFDLNAALNPDKSKTIVSFHDFEGTPEKLSFVYEIFKNTSGQIIKIAAQANDITDTIPIWKLFERAKNDGKKIIPIAMGESGKWTRILGLAHGALMTYAALDDGKQTAPGQISARDLIEVYRAKELDENTEIYGVLGSNTSVSLSPYIHNAAFKFQNLNSVFVPLQVQNLDDFARRMVKKETREIDLNFKGFSVTIPHKQAIIKHLDFVDETAAKIGAVNTVKIADGKLYGYNTDAQGFIEPLLNSYGDLNGAKIAILGAGGAARACVFALKNAGADVTIFARDFTKAQRLGDEFKVQSSKFKTQSESYGEFDILVNATPLGMKGKFEGETPAAAAQLKGLKLVYDLVYVPFQTALMTEADLAEVPKIGGLAMLIAQAAEQQKIWTGIDAPVKEMSRAAMERLK